jgi:hypothetical protein
MATTPPRSRLAKIKIKPKSKKAMKRGPLPNAKAYQNANERAAFKRKATDAVKSIRQDPGSKSTFKKAAIRNTSIGPVRPSSSGAPASQDAKINLPPASTKPILPNSGSAAVVGTPTGGSQILPVQPNNSSFGKLQGNGAGPATKMPIKVGSGGQKVPRTNSGETAKNLNAPGQKKKALGLQSARTLTKPAMRSVAKPPTPARPKAKIKPTLRSPKSR